MRRFIHFTILYFLITFLTGCGDRLDLEKQSISLIYGFDAKAKGKLIVWKIFNTPQIPVQNGGNIGSIWLEEVFSTPEFGHTMQSIAFSPDGKLIATSTASRSFAE